jgi:hypothetical protein
LSCPGIRRTGGCRGALLIPTPQALIAASGSAVRWTINPASCRADRWAAVFSGTRIGVPVATGPAAFAWRKPLSRYARVRTRPALAVIGPEPPPRRPRLRRHVPGLVGDSRVRLPGRWGVARVPPGGVPSARVTARKTTSQAPRAGERLTWGRLTWGYAAEARRRRTAEAPCSGSTGVLGYGCLPATLAGTVLFNAGRCHPGVRSGPGCLLRAPGRLIRLGLEWGRAAVLLVT